MQRMPWTLIAEMLLVCLALAGLPQLMASAVTDTTPPTGTIIINNNRSATNNSNVTLALTWDDGVDGSGVSRMRFSNDGATWSAWEALAATRVYTLPNGDGQKTVRVQYLDKANNRSSVYNDYILLDTTPATGSIIIDCGASTTATQSVTLGLTWSDRAGSGVSRMRFSDDGSHWTAWDTPTATRGHTLPAVLGYHTVRVQYLDGVGNYSAVYNDYIKLVAATEETVLLPGGVPLMMMWVPGGSYLMGRYPGEQPNFPAEDPQHSVTLGGFWMAKYELTKRQWTAVMNTAPWTGYFNVLNDPDSPAQCVSWDDAKSFLSVVNAYTGKNFALPSEAQWEFACRGGTTARFYWGDDPQYIAVGDYAWYFGNSSIYPYVVGAKLPNAFGLYDMSGNVSEWCEDDFHNAYAGAPTGGQAWVDSPRGTYRVARGGCWCNSGDVCRSAMRAQGVPDARGFGTGFRISRNP